MASSTSLPCSKCQLMFSIVTVASSTKIPTAKASPPSVMMFKVSPSADKPTMAPMIDKGMDTAMMSVDRQLPKKSKIIKLVKAAAISPSTATPLIAALTKIDWSLIALTVKLSGKLGFIDSSFAFTPSTMAKVELLPFFKTDIKTERPPST